jgi:putative ABC transport system ATP-binding protein
MNGVRRLVGSGVTVVVATHDALVRRLADEVVELDHGRVKGLDRDPEPTRGLRARGYPGARLPSDAGSAVSVREVTKIFRHHGGDVIHALRGVSVDARPGEVVGLVGRSGSGKTTLLNVIAGWERPTEGSVVWTDGVDPAAPPWSAVAVVPQKLGLMEELTVEENIGYPARLAGVEDERADDLEDLIDVLGLGDLRTRYPREASVGEQQRTAIARALVHDPRIIIADEPTGNLDPVISWEIIQLLLRINELGVTILMATHDAEVVTALRKRVVALEDGRIIRDETGAGYHRED